MTQTIKQQLKKARASKECKKNPKGDKCKAKLKKILNKGKKDKKSKLTGAGASRNPVPAHPVDRSVPQFRGHATPAREDFQMAAIDQANRAAAAGDLIGARAAASQFQPSLANNMLNSTIYGLPPGNANFFPNPNIMPQPAQQLQGAPGPVAHQAGVHAALPPPAMVQEQDEEESKAPSPALSIRQRIGSRIGGGMVPSPRGHGGGSRGGTAAGNLSGMRGSAPPIGTPGTSNRGIISGGGGGRFNLAQRARESDRLAFSGVPGDYHDPDLGQGGVIPGGRSRNPSLRRQLSDDQAAMERQEKAARAAARGGKSKLKDEATVHRHGLGISSKKETTGKGGARSLKKGLSKLFGMGGKKKK